MCDIKELYLQIKLNLSDRPYHRFLWHNMETKEDPSVFEFKWVVFWSEFLTVSGVVCYPKTHGEAPITVSTWGTDSFEKDLHG